MMGNSSEEQARRLGALLRYMQAAGGPVGQPMHEFYGMAANKMFDEYGVPISARSWDVRDADAPGGWGTGYLYNNLALLPSIMDQAIRAQQMGGPLPYVKDDAGISRYAGMGGAAGAAGAARQQHFVPQLTDWHSGGEYGAQPQWQQDEQRRLGAIEQAQRSGVWGAMAPNTQVALLRNALTPDYTGSWDDAVKGAKGAAKDNRGALQMISEQVGRKNARGGGW